MCGPLGCKTEAWWTANWGGVLFVAGLILVIALFGDTKKDTSNRLLPLKRLS
jgi:hypothetical protein